MSRLFVTGGTSCCCGTTAFRKGRSGLNKKIEKYHVPVVVHCFGGLL